ncbi:unnamed protein product [Camellia sinensis]
MLHLKNGSVSRIKGGGFKILEEGYLCKSCNASSSCSISNCYGTVYTTCKWCTKPASVFRMPKPFTLSGWSNLCMLCCLQCSHSRATPWCTEMAQLVCGGCHTLLMYIRGATSVQCSCCHTVNLALEANQVAHVNCGNCRLLLMYQYGARSVKCAVCNFVTSVGSPQQALLNKSSTAKIVQQLSWLLVTTKTISVSELRESPQ